MKNLLEIEFSPSTISPVNLIIPKGNRFTVIDKFPILGTRYRKYFALTFDTQFIDTRRMEIIELLIDNNGNGFIQEFGSVDGSSDLNGFFDFRVSGSEGELLFFPDKFEQMIMMFMV